MRPREREPRSRGGDFERSQSREREGSGECREARWRREENGQWRITSVLTIFTQHKLTMTEKIPEKTVIISSESASQMNGGMVSVGNKPDASSRDNVRCFYKKVIFRRKTIRTETPLPV